MPPLRATFEGRRVVLAGAVATAWSEHIALLRSLGATDVMVIATEGRGGGRQPDVPTVIVEPPARLPVMDSIRFGDRLLASPTAEMLDALAAFDPDRSAVTIGTFLNTTPELDGRPFLAARRPHWEALEDKVVVDAFWDRAGIDRQPSLVVPRDEAAAAASALDRGNGTVWAADARDGVHGGGSQTYWVTDEASAALADRALADVCDLVRVMPFLDGIPCSIHGIVMPDGVVVLRPVEMVTLRSDNRFVYAGCATFWDPAPDVRAQMRSVARRVGHRLQAEIDFRGTFTVDGVVTDTGFWPTELNPRFGAGIMTIGRAADIPMVLLHHLIAGGRTLGRSATQVEHDLLIAADLHRGGGTWKGGFGGAFEAIDRPISQTTTGEWEWATGSTSASAAVTAGAGFI
ncbi:MAG: ATP-grasp domain-containing protein, partial [Ilumatobacteraceae bacterium]